MSHAGFKQTHKTTGVKCMVLFSCFCVRERKRVGQRENVHAEGNSDGILPCCSNSNCSTSGFAIVN